MSTTDSVPVDAAPLMPITQDQAEAAARTVVRLCPDDWQAIMRALGLLTEGRIGPPPCVLTGVERPTPRFGVGR